MVHTQSADIAKAPSGISLADPGPLGLAGFAATTFFLSLVNAGILNAPSETGVLALAFFYGGIAQMIAGVLEFVKGNTFGTLAFVSYGAFWLAFWWIVTKTVPAMVAEKASEDDINHTVGTFLLVFTIFTAYMLIASLKTSGALIAVFAVLTAAFVFLTLGAYNGTEGLTKTGGWLGIITAALAWYASFAGVSSSTFKRSVVPTFPQS